jgi:ketosteroid isomerase-like protein
MDIDRRSLALAGAAAFGAAALLRNTAAQAADDAALNDAVEALRKAVFEKDKAALDKLTAEQLSYGHSSAVVQNKAEFIDGVMNRKATVKSLTFPELKVTMAGGNAIARHRYVSESEQDGKTTNVDIGILGVWTKQDGGWKLLARQGYKLPEKA